MRLGGAHPRFAMQTPACVHRASPDDIVATAGIRNLPSERWQAVGGYEGSPAWEQSNVTAAPTGSRNPRNKANVNLCGMPGPVSRLRNPPNEANSAASTEEGQSKQQRVVRGVFLRKKASVNLCRMYGLAASDRNLPNDQFDSRQKAAKEDIRKLQRSDRGTFLRNEANFPPNPRR
jgi:hypothetical protein